MYWFEQGLVAPWPVAVDGEQPGAGQLVRHRHGTLVGGGGIVGVADHQDWVGGAAVPRPGVAIGGARRPAGTGLAGPRPVRPTAPERRKANASKPGNAAGGGLGLSEQRIARVCSIPEYLWLAPGAALTGGDPGVDGAGVESAVPGVWNAGEAPVVHAFWSSVANALQPVVEL